MKQRKRKQLLIQKQLHEWDCYTITLKDDSRVRVNCHIKSHTLYLFDVR